VDIPKVSVIVCTYNMAKYLPEALNSILSLRYPNLKVIVVDDGSTDETAALISKNYSQHITYIRQPNRGMFVARNVGIEAAQNADYVSVVDADDIVHPLKIWDEVAFLERFRDAVVCFSNILRFARQPEYSEVIWDANNLLGSNKPWGKIENSIEKIAKYNSFTSVSTIRMTALRSVGNYDGILKYGGDLDLAIRLTRVGGIGFINKVRYLYRCEGQGISSYSKDYILDLMRIFDKIRTNPYKFTKEELGYLYKKERVYLLQTFWDTALGAVDPGLRGDIQRKLLSNIDLRDLVKFGVRKCIMCAGMAKKVAKWRRKRLDRIRKSTDTVKFKDAIEDLALCFETLKPEDKR